MKRLICTALASLMLLSAVSCGKISPDTPTVSTTSSEAEKYGDWLADRLGYAPENVILGIGNDVSYGIDLSNFEDDGYIIRTVDGMTLIFGKTADGLDRGVRKYAIATERGEDVSLITYHEGYRIDELRIFGVDISEYVIEYDGAAANANMRFAATELSKLVKKACGFELPINETFTDAAHRIIFRHTDDESLRDDGFNYFEENGCLVIEGAVGRGCMNGVYRFLENECGWRHLIFGTSILEDADLIDIPKGISVSETPAFDYVDDWFDPQRYPYINDRTPIGFNSIENSYGPIKEACHGMYTWSPETGDIDCYTDEGFYEVVYERVYYHIESAVKAGSIIGEQLKEIDIAQKDCPTFCMCEGCSEVYEYDGSFIGPIVQFANRLAEDINKEFPGVIIKIFGYFRTIRPPQVTKPSENVGLTYAPNGNCARHALNDGESCTSKLYQNWNNIEYGGFLEQWCEMSDNVYVWYYSWGLFPKAYTVVDVFYEDLKWFAELGVKGIYINRMDGLVDTTFLTDYMLRELNWNYDMTKEEFEEYLEVLMQDIYGDGWMYIREADNLLRQAQLRAVGCLDIWQYVSVVPKENTYNPFFYDTVFEYIIELTEKAMELAANEKEFFHCAGCAATMYYMGTTGGYFPAYDRGDEERLDWLRSMYDRFLEINEMVGGFGTNGGSHIDLSPIFNPLDEVMWTYFVNDRDIYTAPGTTQRPAPLG